MKTFSFIFGILILAGNTTVWAQMPDTLKAIKWMNSAYAYQDSGRYDSAIHYMTRSFQIWQNAATYDPSITGRWVKTNQFELSKLYIYQEDYPAADSMLQVLLSSFSESNKTDTLYGEVLHNIGSLRYSLQAYNEAETYLNEALAIKKDTYTEMHPSVANTYNMLGNLVSDQGNYLLAEQYYQRALAIRKEVLSEDHPHVADTYQNLGILSYSEGDYDEAIRYMEKGFEIEQRTLPPMHPNLASSYNNLGIMYDIKGNYQKALAYYQQSLTIRKEILGEEHLAVAETYLNLGVVYQEMGDLREAMANYTKSLALHRKLLKNPLSLDIAIVLENMASANLEQDKYTEALSYYQQALDIYTQLFGEQHPNVADIQVSMSKAFIYTAQYQKAMDILKKSEEINLAVRPNHPDQGLIYAAYGEIYGLKKNYEASIKAYDDAVARIKQAYGERHPLVVRILNGKAKVLALKPDKEAAIACYNQALLANLPQTEELSEIETMPGYNVPSKLATPIGKPEYLASLHQQALLIAEDTASTAALTTASYLWEIAMLLIEEMQAAYTYRESKLDLVIKAREIYEAALSARAQLYFLTSNEQHLRHAFQIAERSQAAILHEWIRDLQARQQAGIPQELLEAENNLKVNISFYEKQLYELSQQSPKDSTKILTYRSRLFDARSSHDSLVEVIEKKYPAYYEMKYNRQFFSEEALQESLKADEMVVRYFITSSNLYRFILTQDGFDCKRSGIDSSFTTNIGKVYQSLKTYQWDQDQWQTQLKQFSKTAYELYDDLLGDHLNVSVAKLIIIPDGILGYIPFEALLYEDAESATSYAELPYVIKKYQVSYAYSAQLLLTPDLTSTRSSQKSVFVGFAPQYGSDKTQFSALRGLRFVDSTRIDQLSLLTYNQPEVQALSEIMKGEAFMGQDASESIFKNVAPHAGIIHLAMHALLHDDNPLYSGLVFTQDQEEAQEDNFLYTYEVFNMNFNADLAVLSACNTGAGALHRGEGILSMARAFRYAGCPNLVMSLWQTEDRAAFYLMQAFYQQIKSGNTYGSSLREAKLAYLNNQDQAHPFYWANFIFIGENKALDATQTNWNLLIIGMLVIASVIGAIFFVKKSKS